LKRIILLVGMMTAGAASLCSAAAFYVIASENARLADVQLAVEHTEHDFGRVAQGKLLQHSFTVRNRGARRAVLNYRLDGCCGGTTAIVTANQQIQLPVVLETLGKSGSVTERVRVATSDPRLPEIELVLKAHIVPQQTIEPEPLDEASVDINR
jgi:hypothetical protein